MILPEDHPLASMSAIPADNLTEDPFMLLSRGDRSEVSDLFRERNVKPNIHLTLAVEILALKRPKASSHKSALQTHGPLLRPVAERGGFE